MIEWNLFAEGECEEDEEFALPGLTNIIMYIKRECEVCHQTTWIKHPYTVCKNCIP